MRILLVASAYNSLAQRCHTELLDRGHEVSVELALTPQTLVEAAWLFRPDLVVAPMLTAAIPQALWSRVPCLIVHPGPKGDRGPSSLDWAITTGARRWGVTVLQANEVFDAGDIWAWAPFVVAEYDKSSLYRHEVTEAAVEALLLAVARMASGHLTPEPLDYDRHDVIGEPRPALRQPDRRIDWAHEPTEDVLRKLRAATSQPGVLDTIDGEEFFLYGGIAEDTLRGPAGSLLAMRDTAVCRATADGAVWITHVKPRTRPDDSRPFKVPATVGLALHLSGVPQVAAPQGLPDPRRTYREIHYWEHHQVGYLEFDFPNGAMSTRQCRRLLAAYRYALSRHTRVIVLGGRRDFFANGIHLHVIEDAPDAQAESWENINAMNDLVAAILTTTSHLVISAVQGNAAAGGLMLALAADEVWCRSGAVLNPHYRLMGLSGSEYWTYTLPRRVGEHTAEALTSRCLPVNARQAHALGLADQVVPGDPATFRTHVTALAEQLAHSADLPGRLEDKTRRHRGQSLERTLERHRARELDQMREDFASATYQDRRSRFVRRIRPETTPAHLALHRT
ncbi:hydrogenase maturation factor HoxX [Longimycelium tulufanense]|uniref:Hydrogenase maturation factor HoxX n=1 Tax=Longimycelium tulufanense TaxID=907463 RepID=A0A8J3CDN3_9PSEU|nr:hydrogenase maturation protein [Longimycelium tulufanense]GGM78876.1 hydrogenase maturation factor HoxX [Longimycelium tulufanense]